MAKYVERGGEQAFAPPFLQSGTRMQGFLLKGDPAALQATVDRYLNTPSGGATSYRVLMSHVILGYAPIASTRSTQPPGSERGYTPETDVAFWVLVGAGHQDGPIWVLDRIAWFLPYVWVDIPTTMATGREVYGYPKELGWLTTPASSDAPLVFAMETMVLPVYTPQTELQRQPILKIERVGKVEAASAASLAELLAAIKAVIAGDPIVPGIDFWVHLAEYLLRKEVPMVFLKEFRDVVDPTQACYQAILESPARIEGWPTGGLLTGEHVVTLHDYASHPVAAELGLGTPTDGVLVLTPALALHVEMDFLVELATVIWQAST